MVPFSSATTWFSSPALIRLWAPMMLRVRPAQFTTTRVDGSLTSSFTRCTSSAPGQSVAPGMLIRRYSSRGRESSTTTLSPASRRALRSAAPRWGVP